jgi:hypothetical protein
MKLELIKFEDRLFDLYRRINKDRIKDTNQLKEIWNCDTVLEKEGYFYFCNEIKEAQIIEDEPINNTQNAEDTTTPTTEN